MNKEILPEIKVKERYMILYAYNGRISNDEAKEIKQVAKEKGIKVYSIGGAQPYADKFINCDPFEVLAYFKNAEYIVTDTFHGSIFAIINNKPFVTLIRKSKGNLYGNEEKLTFLLKELNLEDRIIFDVQDLKAVLDNGINYYDVNKILTEEKHKTREYLKNNL